MQTLDGNIVPRLLAPADEVIERPPCLFMVPDNNKFYSGVMLRSFDMLLCTTASAGTVLSADPRQALLASAHGRYATPWHWHDCMMLLMPRVGALDLRHQDRLEGVWVSEDRFAIVPANHIHQTQALRDTHAHLTFYITDEALQRIEAEAGSLARVKRRIRSSALFGTTPEIKALQNLCQKAGPGQSSSLRHISAALLMSCLSEIERADPLPVATPRGHGAAIVQEVQDLVADGAAEDVSLDLLAERLNISRRHMTRLFRKQTGKSIAEFHQSMRIALARRMLTDTDLPVGEIAFRVGFESGSALSRAVRRADGISPSAIRRAMARPVNN
jgi:AraC family transcriptional regulator